VHHPIERFLLWLGRVYLFLAGRHVSGSVGCSEKGTASFLHVAGVSCLATSDRGDALCSFGEADQGMFTQRVSSAPGSTTIVLPSHAWLERYTQIHLVFRTYYPTDGQIRHCADWLPPRRRR
jgi:hypothetical protein